jgi:hypothetical protein
MSNMWTEKVESFFKVLPKNLFVDTEKTIISERIAGIY